MSRRSETSGPPAADRRHHLPRAGAVGGVGPARRRAPRAVRRRGAGRGRRTGAAAAGVGVRRGGCRRGGRASTGWSSAAAPTWTRRATARSRTRAPPPGARTATRGRRRCCTRPTRPACPTLGVCRGMQLMAVRGRRHAGAAHARPGRPRRAQPRRRRLRHDRGARPPRSRGCARWSGRSVEVGCHHHQTVATHPGFEADRLGRRRLARGDGAARGRASAWPSSGTPRSATTRACSPGWSAPRPAAALTDPLTGWAA